MPHRLILIENYGISLYTQFNIQKLFIRPRKWSKQGFLYAYPPLHCLHAYKITPLHISMVIEGQGGMELSHIGSRLCQPGRSAHTQKSATQYFHYALRQASSVVRQDNRCFVAQFLPSEWPQPRTSRLFFPEFTICLVEMWPQGTWLFILPPILQCICSVE